MMNCADHDRPATLGRSIRAVLFDMDGTLTRPLLDFPRIKQAMGCPQDRPILEWLATQPADRQADLERILIDHEICAARSAVASAGATEIVAWLHARGCKVAIITRNCHQAVAITLEQCDLRIDTLWTREDVPRKPSGLAVVGLCNRLGVTPEESVVVGDFKFDLEAAREAGAAAVLMLQETDLPDWAHLADAVIRDLNELKGLL